MNLPNSITMSRIVMIPLLLWILSAHFPWQGPRGEQEIAASVLFVLASITDGVDGYLARKRKQITTMGILLDPLADKVMVTGALIALVAYNPQVVKVWIVVLIIGREFLISGLRSIASSEGFTIEASDLGKLKTVVQIVSVVSAILAHRWEQWQFGVLIVPVRWIAVAAIYFTVLVSTVSAIDYFVGFWKKIDHASKDRRKSFVLSRRKGMGGPFQIRTADPRVESLEEDTTVLAALRQNLRLKAAWDESKVDRLIELERVRLGNVPLQTLMEAAIERCERDNR